MKAKGWAASGGHRLVLAELLGRRQATRSDLIAALDLSPATVSRAIDAFLSVGLVNEISDVRRGTPGRRRMLLEVDGDFAHVAGVDVGASSSRFVIVGLTARRIKSLQVETPSGLSATALADWIADTLRDLQDPAVRVDRVCVGLPGAVHVAARTITNAPNLPQIENPEFVRRLEERLEQAVGIDNDANYALLSEQKLGAAAGTDSAGMLTIGAGLGGAIAIAGRIVQGRHGIVGEFGHLLVAPLGARLETMVTGPALVARASELGSPIDSPAALFRAAPPPQLEPLIMQFDNALLVALTALVVSADPEVVVIGGGVAKSLASRIPHYESELERNLSFRVPLAIAELGDFSGAIGAAVAGLQSVYLDLGVTEEDTAALPRKVD